MGGPGSPEPLSLSPSGRPEPGNLPSRNGDGRSAPGSSCSLPQVPPPSQPLQLAHPPSPRRHRQPFPAQCVPCPARSDPGGRTRPPPRPPTVLTRCSHFLLVLVLVFGRTRRIRPHRHRGDPSGRPAGPAGAEEAQPRRPPGGSAARYLLKAPRLPRLVMWCLFVSGLWLLSFGQEHGGLDLGWPFLSVFTFKSGGVGIFLLPFGSDRATEFSFIKSISVSSAVFSPSPKVIHWGPQRAVGDPDNQ